TMKRWLEALEAFAIDVILERRYGKRASLLRGVLYFLSLIYQNIVQLRLRLFRNRLLRAQSLGCPVISVGNLTVGGTGKTPVVEMLARELTRQGRRVGILTRGYKSVPKPLLRRLGDKLFKNKAVFAPRIVSDGRTLLLDSLTAGDEPFMLANNLRGVVVLVDRDRVKSGYYAIEHFGCDTLLLDDGFQYLRLRHSYEIALVDRQAPFGNRFILPRGTLREPKENLCRATHIFVTKSSAEPDTPLLEEIRQYNRTADIIECAHRPVHFRDLISGEIHPLDFVKGKRAASLCGIAVPESFEEALRKLGAGLELTEAFTDHHRFTAREIESFLRRCGRRGVEMILTTEKDAVRIPRILDAEVPIYYLRVEIEILRGQEQWEALVRRLAPAAAPEFAAV
ncbi:MAG TPA: tetraacyldisaccharide 4'-kinase, partial [Chthoniobacterales bacterium]